MMVSFYVTASSEKDERKTRCLLEARDTVRVPIFQFLLESGKSVRNQKVRTKGVPKFEDGGD